MGEINREVYHTQKYKSTKLDFASFCTNSSAWLGEAYYFWVDVEFAHFWGTQKAKIGYNYDIYSCNIASDKIIDTVFNEVEYRKWIKLIEKFAIRFAETSDEKPEISDISMYFTKHLKGLVDGILFQDLPPNEDFTVVTKFFYKKRIQLAVYNKNIISNFKCESTHRRQ